MVYMKSSNSMKNINEKNFHGSSYTQTDFILQQKLIELVFQKYHT